MSEPDIRELELYKLAVEMADRTSARRSTANTFFLMTQTAFITVIGVAAPNLQRAPWLTTLAVALAGALLSASWWLQLRSYRALNRVKFDVISEIEERLPVKIFSNEWTVLKKEQSVGWRGRYIELGVIERVLPSVFAFLYTLLFLSRVI